MHSYIDQHNMTLYALLLAGFCLGAGQNIIAPLLSPLAAEFGLSAHEKDFVLAGGAASSFFLVGAPVSVLVGSFADSPAVPRRFLVLGLCLLAAAGAVASAAAQAPWQLLVARAVPGVAFGSASPVLLSLLGDMTTAGERPKLAATVGLVIGSGTAVFQVLAGLMIGASPNVLSWRAPFLAIAIACLIAAAIVAIFVLEPIRGAMDSVEALPPRSRRGKESVQQRAPPSVPLPPPTVHSASSDILSQAARVLSVPSNLRVFAQSLFGTAPWSVIAVFLPDFLVAERGLTTAGAAGLVLLFGLGGVAGGVLGGTAGSFLLRRRPAALPLVFGAAQAAAALPMLWLINTPLLLIENTDESSGGSSHGSSMRWSAYAVAVVAGLLASLTGPNIKAVLMSVNAHSARGSALSFAYFTDALARGVTPPLLGLAVAHAGASRRAVFSLAVLGWCASGAIIASIARTMPDDVERVRKLRRLPHGDAAGEVASAPLAGGAPAAEAHPDPNPAAAAAAADGLRRKSRRSR